MFHEHLQQLRIQMPISMNRLLYWWHRISWGKQESNLMDDCSVILNSIGDISLLPSSNTTSMLSMLQLSSSMDYDNFRWSPQSSTDGWSLSVELNHNDSVLAIEITFEDFVEDMSNICYRSETWISASLVVSIFRHAWPPTCEAKSKIICIWGNVLANFTNSTTHFFFFRQNTRFPSTFLEKFPEKFELQTCGNKKKFTKPKMLGEQGLILVAEKTHFGFRQDNHSWVLRSNKKLRSEEPYPLQSENTSCVLTSTSTLLKKTNLRTVWWKRNRHDISFPE